MLMTSDPRGAENQRTQRMAQPTRGMVLGGDAGKPGRDESHKVEVDVKNDTYINVHTAE